jgi:hypothetical protein
MSFNEVLFCFLFCYNCTTIFDVEVLFAIATAMSLSLHQYVLMTVGVEIELLYGIDFPKAGLRSTVVDLIVGGFDRKVL